MIATKDKNQTRVQPVIPDISLAQALAKEYLNNIYRGWEQANYINDYTRAHAVTYSPDITGRISAVAPCREVDPDLFFSLDPDDVKSAKAICNKCIIMEECRQAAVEMEIEHGVWGGVNFNKKGAR